MERKIEPQEEKITVFVTYAWQEEEENMRVASLTNHLREEGFEAEIDILKSQQETSISFIKMIHTGMTQSNKVIVVLSPGYKKKAEEFTGGVGEEYQLILNDIQHNPRKYILVSFVAYSADIVPLGLQGRETINVSDPKNLKVLYARLKNTQQWLFSELGQKTPIIEQKTIPSLENRESGHSLPTSNFVAHEGKTNSFSRLYRYSCQECILRIKNNGRLAIDDYTVKFGGTNT